MRKDNRGMTLIELLVAIAMLGVVISPFLKTFTMSARQNHKARETLRATTVAQNLMEGLEAFSLEDVCNQVNKNTGPNSMLYRPYGYEEHVELGVKLADNIIEKSGNGLSGEDYVFSNTSSNKYEIGIKGIEEDGKFYDAKVLLDASCYPAYNENDEVEVEVEVMNEASDVIFTLSQEEEKEILEKLGQSDWSKIKRTFFITINKENGNVPKENRKITIKVTYTDTTGNKTIEGNSLTKTVGNLKNVYVFYYPNYSSIGTNVLDVFEVNFKRESFFNLNLIKEKYKDNISRDDSKYAASLSVKDTNNHSQGTVARITLRTNIPEDLYGNGGPYEYALQSKYAYANEQTPEEVKRLLNYNGNLPQTLGKKKSITNVIYETTVQVFPEGTYPDQFDSTEPLAELSNKNR